MQFSLNRASVAFSFAFCALCAAAAGAQSAPEFNELGIRAYNSGQFGQAITYFDKALADVPDNGTLRRNLCNALQAEANELAQGAKFPDATKLLERAVKLDPQNHSPLIQLGSYYLRQDKVSEAIHRLEDAIEVKPGELDAHELLGEAYYRDNDISSARAQWDYVLQIAPERPGLRERYEKAFREESVEYDFNRHGSRNFNVSYPDGLPYQVRARVVSILESAYWTVGKKLGGVYPPPPVQVILYEAEQFTEATQLEAHVGAVFDGKIRAPVTDSSGNYLPDEELKRRLTHEYVHVVIRHLAGPAVPWWVNEGLAETFSKQMSEADYSLLERAYEGNLSFRLGELEGSQLAALKPDVLRLAYSQSHATARFLWTRHGRSKLTTFLNDIAAGKDPEQSLQDIYRRDYVTLEQEVANMYR